MADHKIVKGGLKVLGHIVKATGDTPTKKAGTGTAIYGAINLDPVTTGIGLCLRFHDKADALAKKVKDVVMGIGYLKTMVDEANAKAQEEIAKEQ